MKVAEIMAGSVKSWEEKFSRWAVGPATTESTKCDNAERMVRDAINAYQPLQGRTIRVFAQGSYRNRTNVRMDSDVDICVLCEDTVFSDYTHAPGVNDGTLGFTPATYSFAELKRDVENAMVAKFGKSEVKRGSKAVDIKANSYRVATDVVPTFEGRLYFKNSNGVLTYHSGTVLECDSTWRRINNWPEQHYANGVSKHGQTGKQFKKKARILKNLCNEMSGGGSESAKAMASYLLESLVYNCPDTAFSNNTHHADMKSVIGSLWDSTDKESRQTAMTEVNGIKYLFHSDQPWKLADVRTFLQDAWNYAGFGS